MKKALLWMLVFFLSLGVYSAQAQSGLPQAAGWLNPEIFERYPSYFVEETTGKWRVRTLEADALLDRFWSDGADYDGELCIFFPEIEGYFQSGVWMPVLRMYFMRGSREVQAHAVALRVDETVYTLPAHTAIVENGRHAAEVVSVPLGEYAAQVLSALDEGEDISLRLIGERIYTQSLDAESSRERDEIACASRETLAPSTALFAQAGMENYTLWDLSNAAWEAEYGYPSSLEMGDISSQPVIGEDAVLDDDFGLICPDDRDEAAVATQEILIEAGFLSGEAANTFDDEAVAATLRAQRFFGRIETGCMDIGLIRALRGGAALETEETVAAEAGLVGESVEIFLERYWFAQAYHPMAAPASIHAVSNRDNVFFLADGWIRNVSSDQLRLFTDCTARVVYNGGASFDATLSCERDAQTQFDSTLIPLAQTRLVLSAEIPRALALEADAQWQIEFQVGTETLAYAIQ